MQFENQSAIIANVLRVVAGELLSDDELDNVAGGAGAMGMNNVGNQRNIWDIFQNNNLSNVPYGDNVNPACALGDERDNVNPACMSAAFINGEITGGEDF